MAVGMGVGATVGSVVGVAVGLGVVGAVGVDVIVGIVVVVGLNVSSTMMGFAELVFDLALSGIVTDTQAFRPVSIRTTTKIERTFFIGSPGLFCRL